MGNVSHDTVHPRNIIETEMVWDFYPEVSKVNSQISNRNTELLYSKWMEVIEKNYNLKETFVSTDNSVRKDIVQPTVLNCIV